MSIAQILSKAQTLGVHLRVEGDKVKFRGPASAIEAIKPELAAHKTEIMRHLSGAANDPATEHAFSDDCAGALQSADGGLYLPWGAYLDPASVNRMRGELVALIEELADLEQWDSGRCDDVLTRAIRGPLSDLQPNMHHFHERLAAALAEKEARDLADSRSWRVTDEALRSRGRR